MDTNILLESGTNELEILEFKLGNNHYGINVAKIREILSYQQVTPVPNTHPSVEGVFMPRDTMITVISLKRCLGMEDSGDNGLFIITNFNKLDAAFHVDQVVGIHRVSWGEIIKPDSTINSVEGSVATGVVKIDGKLVVILDFEAIVAGISPETGLQVNDIEQIGERERSEEPILIAEDSPLLSSLITDCLRKSGYDKLTITYNGQEAWDKIQDFRKKGILNDKVRCVITDIEMPLMDGHRLTKLIKSDNELKKIPNMKYLKTKKITTNVNFIANHLSEKELRNKLKPIVTKKKSHQKWLSDQIKIQRNYKIILTEPKGFQNINAKTKRIAGKIQNKGSSYKGKYEVLISDSHGDMDSEFAITDAEGRFVIEDKKTISEMQKWLKNGSTLYFHVYIPNTSKYGGTMIETIPIGKVYLE